MILTDIRRKLSIGLFLAVFVIAGIPTSRVEAVGPNLVVNPSLETATVAGIPDNWFTGTWGTSSTTFTYPTGGATGVGANVTMSSYGSGDSKWYFKNVPVTGGTKYDFSDSYNSTVNSLLVVEYTSNSNALSYEELASLPSSQGAWKSATASLIPPANTTSLTVYHLIQGVGSLSTDDYSLTLSATTTNPGGGGSTTTPPTGFTTGLVSLTFDDGYQSQLDNAAPILKSAKLKGSFYVVSDAMKNADHPIFPSADNPFNVASTSKSATWSEIYTDPDFHNFTFTDTYTANAASTITVTYTPTGKKKTSLKLGTVPAGANLKAHFSFKLPAITGPLTIAHAVTGNSAKLQTSNVLVTQQTPYMNADGVLALKAAGHEMGNHTVSHCDLVAILNDPSDTSTCAFTTPSPATVQEQIANAKTTFADIGITTDTLAYPYGSGAGNTDIKTIVQSNGLIAGRSVDVGYNLKTTNPYGLLTQNIDANTTAANVKAWIDYAAANKVWLILTYHQVETSASYLSAHGETYGTTAAILQNTANYLATQQKAGKIKVDTVHNVVTTYMK